MFWLGKGFKRELNKPQTVLFTDSLCCLYLHCALSQVTQKDWWFLPKYDLMSMSGVTSCSPAWTWDFNRSCLLLFLQLAPARPRDATEDNVQGLHRGCGCLFWSSNAYCSPSSGKYNPFHSLTTSGDYPHRWLLGCNSSLLKQQRIFQLHFRNRCQL